MAQQQEIVQSVKLPLFGPEIGYQSTLDDVRNSPQDQLFTNCYPLVNKSPLQDDAGEVRIYSRPGFKNPLEGNNSLLTHLGGTTVAGTASVKAALGIRGLPYECIVLVYSVIDTAVHYLKVIAYRPDVAAPNDAILIGTVNITSYNLDMTTSDVHLTQITNGAGLIGVAMVFHPKAYTTSTSTNSDAYYAITTGSPPAFVAAPGAGSLAAISDGDFPTNTPAKGLVGPLQQLNNVHYVMATDGYIYGSYPSLTGPAFNPDITTWDAAGYTYTGQNLDGGAGLQRYKNHLLAFGQTSCEFFNDEAIAQPSLPIRRTQQAYFKIGLLSAKAICTMDDELYWVGVSGDTNQIALYKLSGYTPEVLSTVKIHNLLRNYKAVFGNNDTSAVNLQVINLNGSRHIVTNIQVQQPTSSDLSAGEAPENQTLYGGLCYCLESNAWWVMAFDNSGVSIADGRPSLFNAITHTGSEIMQWCWIQINTTGTGGYNYGLHPCKMSRINDLSGYYQYDSFRCSSTTGPVIIDSWTIPVKFTTNTYDFGTGDRKTINRLRLIMRTPATDQSDEAESSPLELLNDAGLTLSCSVFKDRKADNTITATAQDLTYTHNLQTLIDNPSFNWNNLGTFRKIKFAVECNTYMALQFLAFEANVRKANH
jgi:hypothetical protein